MMPSKPFLHLSFSRKVSICMFFFKSMRLLTDDFTGANFGYVKQFEYLSFARIVDIYLQRSRKRSNCSIKVESHVSSFARTRLTLVLLRDGDGKTTAKQLGTAMSALGQNLMEVQLPNAINEADTDGNALLTSQTCRCAMDTVKRR